MLRTIALSMLGAAMAAGQNFDDIKIEKIAAGQIYTDGPVWSREGFSCGAIHRLTRS
jgi:hypothetical protein